MRSVGGRLPPRETPGTRRSGTRIRSGTRWCPHPPRSAPRPARPWRYAGGRAAEPSPPRGSRRPAPPDRERSPACRCRREARPGRGCREVPYRRRRSRTAPRDSSTAAGWPTRRSRAAARARACRGPMAEARAGTRSPASPGAATISGRAPRRPAPEMSRAGPAARPEAHRDRLPRSPRRCGRRCPGPSDRRAACTGHKRARSRPAHCASPCRRACASSPRPPDTGCRRRAG